MLVRVPLQGVNVEFGCRACLRCEQNKDFYRFLADLIGLLSCILSIKLIIYKNKQYFLRPSFEERHTPYHPLCNFTNQCPRVFQFLFIKIRNVIQSYSINSVKTPIQTMTHIITLEEISDVDTITLQQKLEELQLQTHPEDYYDIISIVKLQLQERYKVEQFGRMLLNGQFESQNLFEVKYEKPKQIYEISPKYFEKEINIKKKTNVAELLKRSLVSNDNIIIGKPALANYRYVPKNNSASNLKKKSYSKQGTVSSKMSLPISKRSTNFKQPKKATNVQLPPINKRHSKSSADQTKAPSTTRISSHASSSSSSLKASQKFETTASLQKELSKKIETSVYEKSKKINVKFMENDIYEEKRLENCQNLGEIIKQMNQEQLNEYESVKTETETEQIEEQFGNSMEDNQQEIKVIEKELQKTEEKQIQEQKQEIQIKEDIITEQTNIDKSEKLDKKQIQQESEKQTEKINEMKPEQGHLQLQIQKLACSKLHDHQNNNKFTIRQEIIFSSQNSHKIEQLQDSPKKKQEIIFQKTDEFKRLKSQSVKNMSNFIMPDWNRESDVFDSRNSSIQQSHLPSKSQPIKQQKISEPNKFLKSKRKVDKIQIVSTALYYPYHQIIPNFAKLFPHSSNLISDLRFIQQELQKHISKNVLSSSLNDEYLRIRESQLLCQTVSECEKSKKYQYLFDIDLSKFLERGAKMLARINKQSVAPEDNNALLYRVVRQKQQVYDIVNNCFHRTNDWFELPHGMDLKISWNLLWTWSRPQIQLKSLCYFQKVNHFFGNKQIARKDLLKKNIERVKRLGKNAKKAFDIIPETFYLPGQNMQFIKKFREYASKNDINYWILKPVGMSRGRGIQLINKIEDIVFNQPIVLQKYLLNPLLLNGYKFDMRIYVLVTSINPLEAYVYKQGFARISTQKYSTEEEKLADKFIHLTNFSVQKDNLDEKQSKAKKTFDEEVGGCKITLKMLRQKLGAAGINWKTIQSQIHSIVVKSLISVMNSIQPNPNCFELFGYDIIADENLKCWLIQVNSSPSLEKEFVIDEVLKQQLLDDVIQIVDPVAYNRERLLEVVSRRRKQLQGYKSHIRTSNNSNQQLDSDIDYILHGKKISRYGQRGDHINFVRLAPGQLYSSILKTVQQYKKQNIEKQY